MISAKSVNWKRKITLHERLYTMAEKINPPFVMQFIIEGKGLLDADLLQQKLHELAEIIPIIKLKPEGKYWTFNGPKPEIKVHYSPLPVNWNDDVFTAPLNSNEGKCLEFHLFQTENSTLLFRVLHSAMDGIGALKLLQHLFSLLNNQSVNKISEHPKDFEVRNAIPFKPKTIRGSYKIKWKGLAKENLDKVSFNFKTELIEFPERIEGIAGAIAKWYMNETSEAARFLIPVNIRRHCVCENALSNLSLPIYLETFPNQSKEEIQSQLLTEMANNKELANDPLEKAGDFVPDFILRKFLKSFIAKNLKSNRYLMSGFISDLGKIELENFSMQGFEAINFFSLPVYTALAPFCLISCHHQFGTRIAFSVNDCIDISSVKQNLQNALIPNQTKLSIPEPTDQKFTKDLLVIWSEILKITETEIGLNTRFNDLGGDSIQLLFMIDVVGKKFVPNRQSPLMADVLKFAGSITINLMIPVILKYTQNK